MFGIIFFSLRFRGYGICANSVANHLKTLHKSRKNLGLVRLVGCLSSRIKFVVFNANSNV